MESRAVDVGPELLDDKGRAIENDSKKRVHRKSVFGSYVQRRFLGTC